MPAASYFSTSVRKTLGWGKDGDFISLKQFREGVRRADGTWLDHGTQLNNQTILNALHGRKARKGIDGRLVPVGPPGLVELGLVSVQAHCGPRFGDGVNYYRLASWEWIVAWASNEWEKMGQPISSKQQLGYRKGEVSNISTRGLHDLETQTKELNTNKVVKLAIRSEQNATTDDSASNTTSLVIAKPATEGRFKNGQRAAAKTPPGIADLNGVIMPLQGELTALANALHRGLGAPSLRTAANIWAAARKRDAGATPGEIIEFLRQKLFGCGRRWQNWGGAYTAVSEDFPRAVGRSDAGVASPCVEPDAAAPSVLPTRPARPADPPSSEWAQIRAAIRPRITEENVGELVSGHSTTHLRRRSAYRRSTRRRDPGLAGKR